MDTGTVSMGTMTGAVKGAWMGSEDAGAVALARPESLPQFARLYHDPTLHQCFNVIFVLFASLLAKKHCSKCSPMEQVSLLGARAWNPELFKYRHLPEAPGWDHRHSKGLWNTV